MNPHDEARLNLISGGTTRARAARDSEEKYMEKKDGIVCQLKVSISRQMIFFNAHRISSKAPFCPHHKQVFPHIHAMYKIFKKFYF